MSTNAAVKEETCSPLLEVYAQYPFTLERGEGVYVWDTDGNKYLDFYGGHAVCSIGHSPREVIEAIRKQAETMMFYSNLARIPIREQGARALLEFGEFDSHSAFFCNSGGEANENAIKMAMKVSGRQKIVSYHGAFHGRTMLAMAATDHPDWHEYVSSWMGEVQRITPNNETDLSAIDETTACVILEPIQSIGGVTKFEQEYLKKLRARCDKVGAFLIFDEVQTGIGRVGVPFVSGGWGVWPDMTTLAKGLAGGFAIGAVIFRENIAKEIKVGDIAATFGGGPMAIAGMIATLSVIKEKNLMQNTQKIETYLKEKCSTLTRVQEVRGAGCLLGIVIDSEALPVRQKLFQKGIITGGNADKNLVHLLPPLTISTEHVDIFHSALQEVLQ